MENNENNNKKLKNIVKSIIEDSTIHGLPRILKANNLISKITWIICSCISTGFCLYLIVAAIINFFEYKVMTTIETKTEMPANFPVITICNLNQLQTNESFEIIQKYSQINYLSNVYKYFYLMNELSSYNKTFQKSLSYSLNESLIKCTINTQECSESDFVWTFDTATYGNCYSFNTGFNSKGNSVDLIQITKAGNLNGLKLELFIGHPQKIPNFIETFGYHVIIHNQTYPIAFNEGYDISTGVETNLIVSRSYETSKPKPYSDCTDLSTLSFDSYLYQVIIGLNQTYRQSDCIVLCFQQLLIQSCKCYTSTANKLNGTIQCLNETQMNCVVEHWKVFLFNDYVAKNCVQYCPLECYSITYQVTSTFSNYPNYKYALNSLISNPILTSKLMMDTSNETMSKYDLVKQSVLSLNVYYDQLGFIEITREVKLEIVDLVSGIGGLLGLFLGMSFLSFAELIEIILETLAITLEKYKTSKKSNKVSKRQTKINI